MQTYLRWQKEIFSSSYLIYKNGELIGKLKGNSFYQTANGELNGKKYIFKSKGFLKQHTAIVDRLENKFIGDIFYNDWMTKATILINHKPFNWKYDNIWTTKWSIFTPKGISIIYSGTSLSGHIDSSTDEELILLSGLFVTNYYWQMTILTLVLCFIPIWLLIYQLFFVS